MFETTIFKENSCCDMLEKYNSSFISPHPLNTAVLFLVFNRLDTTKEVFRAISQAKPPRLYIAADAARANIENEVKKVQDVREHIMQNINWKCEVKTLFREKNLGCKYAVSSAISWFFDNEEQGIILEDDCLPSQSFFWYCEELLIKYRNDKSVYLISGETHDSEFLGLNEDYGFCKYPLLWGWASWNRAWKNYDPEMKDWQENRNKLMPSISHYKPTLNFWEATFDKMYKREIDTWDYQFAYLLLNNGGKCIFPKCNLVSNIGFGIDATRTSNPTSEAANRKRYEINIPLKHSPNPKSEEKVNKFYDINEFSKKHFIVHAFNKIIYKLLKIIFGQKKTFLLKNYLKDKLNK